MLGPTKGLMKTPEYIAKQSQTQQEQINEKRRETQI